MTDKHTGSESKAPLQEPELAHAKIDPAYISTVLRGLIATGDHGLLATGAEGLAHRMDEIAEARVQATEHRPKGRGVVRYILLDRLNRNANPHSAADDTIERLEALALEYENDAPQYAPYRICAVVEMKATEHQSADPEPPDPGLAIDAIRRVEESRATEHQSVLRVDDNRYGPMVRVDAGVEPECKSVTWTRRWAEQGGRRTAGAWWDRLEAGESIEEIAADHKADPRVVAYAIAGVFAGMGCRSVDGAAIVEAVKACHRDLSECVGDEVVDVYSQFYADVIKAAGCEVLPADCGSDTDGGEG